MQRLKFLFPALLLLSLLTAACTDKTVQVYEANLPVYMSVESFRATNFQMEAPKPLQHPGKIYIYNHLLIVNDLMTGVHIYDNTNPSAPQDLGFLPVHANMDIAVRNDVMYLDNYTDLIAFNISNPAQPEYLCRVENVFEFLNYGMLPGYNGNMPSENVDDSKGIVTSWIQGETVQEAGEYYEAWLGSTAMDNFSGGVTTNTGGFSSPNNIGLAGSTAKFAIWDDVLYTLEETELGVFDISNCPSHLLDISLNRRSETLFPYQGRLFIGTTTGMIIYDINIPRSPQYLSDYAHVTSCDPVVVQGDKAFVTLSTGTTCFGNVNELQVIDISNILTPWLMHAFPMTNPKGLGLDGNTLFLCDGPDGLKVFDKTDLSTIDQHLISHFTGIKAADVIPNGGYLLMTSAEGIFQYDYSDIQNIVEISHIPTQP